MRNKYQDRLHEVNGYYEMMYPDKQTVGINEPRRGYTLDEVGIQEFYSEIMPKDVSLEVTIGPVTLNVNILSAAMETVCGPELAKALADVGACGILDPTKEKEEQFEWLIEVLEHKTCRLSKPKILEPNKRIYDAKRIHQEFDFSTIPIVADGKLEGVVFTPNIMYEDHLNERVTVWMKPLDQLRCVGPDTPFEEIKDYMKNRQKTDSVLPVVDEEGQFFGMYFMLDFLGANPSVFNGKPVVGVAIGGSDEDYEFAKEAVEIGAAIVVIDSSHGDSKDILNQARRVVKAIDGRAAVITGNYANILGYIDLCETGVDGAKFGIGTGSICTTSTGTGIAKPAFTGLQESDFVRRHRINNRRHAALIIADGGINVPGHHVKACAAGADLSMAGKMLVAASESLAHSMDTIRFEEKLFVRYRGMASEEVLRASQSKRYGRSKVGPEGISGYVRSRGPLRTWFYKDLELMKNGFAHVWATCLDEIHQYGQWENAFYAFSSAGLEQVATRLDHP
jgi:IMP dehydrogenase